jgi:hypothetical protein
MAIKGKGRTRARQPVRAPRRAPVPVKPPLARRRGVQALAAFVAGLLVFWGGVWLTNGLRAEQAGERNRTEAIQRRQVGSSWNQLVSTEVGKIGQVQEGRPPVILPEVRATIGELKEDTPKGAVAQLQADAAQAKRVIDAIAAFDLSGTIRGKGFDQTGVLRFLSARDELIDAIDLYRECALLAAAAADLEPRDRNGVLDRAEALLAKADNAVSRFYLHHTEAMAAAGIVQQPTFPGG